MTSFICLFFPTFLIIEVNKTKKVIDYIKEYCIYNIILNFICLLIVGLLQDFEYIILDKTAFTALFTIKYIMLSTIIALIINILKNRFTLKIEFNSQNN